jgi:NDP-sugar pyrophosphorylase family protein
MTLQPLQDALIQQYGLQCEGIPPGVAVDGVTTKSGFYVCVTHADWRCFMLPGSRLHWPSQKAIHYPGEALPEPPHGGYTTPPVRQPQRVTDQAMILGAGLATRFEPLSGPLTGLPKPGVPLLGTDSVIMCLARHLYGHGIRRLVVNTYYHPDVVKAQLGALAQQLPDLQLLFVDEAAPSGTAGGLVKAIFAGHVQPDKPILVMQGDAVTNADLSRLLLAHPPEAMATLGVKTVTDADIPKMAVVKTDNPLNQTAERVTFYLEKPTLDQAGSSRTGSIGFYVLNPQAYANFCTMGERRYPDTYDFAMDYFPWLLANRHGLMAYALPQPFYWSDIGQPKDYLTTVRSIHQGSLPPPHSPNGHGVVYHEGVVYWPKAWQAVSSSHVTITGNAIATTGYP